MMRPCWCQPVATANPISVEGKLPLLLDDDEEPDLTMCLLYSRGLWAYPLTVRVTGDIKYICSGSCLKRLQSTG